MSYPKIKIITTFSKSGYLEYGKNFVESCRKYLSSEISLVLYVDDNNILLENNWQLLIYKDTIPEMTVFRETNQHRGVSSYIYDGVRFAYKSYAMCHASRQQDCDILIWLDADTVIQKPVNAEYFLNFYKPDTFVSYIGRKGAPETGFIIFDLNHSISSKFFTEFQDWYDTNRIYELPEYHDAYVFKHIVDQFENQKMLTSKNLIEGQTVKHPLNFLFDGSIIHYKGEHKSKDAIRAHQEYKKKNKIGKYADGKS